MWLERLVLPTLRKLSDKKTAKKIVVFESDDWGSIRMSSRQSFDYFLKKGFAVDGCVFNRNDSLERNEDVEGLLEVLGSVKNRDSLSPIFTLNMNMANPDFDSIESSGFSDYVYETFDKSFSRNSNSDRVIDLYKEGLRNRLFFPQFHGREHVHVSNWLGSLQKSDFYSVEAFRHRMFTVSRSYRSSNRAEFVDALAIYTNSQEKFILDSIRDGLNLFEAVWNFRSETAIAPCYTWSESVDRELAKCGVLSLQSGRAQVVPLLNKPGYSFRYRSLGEVNNFGQTYLVRNVYFEPATDESIDWIDTTLKNIDKCFHRKVPAIISSHRVNYIGSIRSFNRDRNLTILKGLLMAIVKNWPDVEFVSSQQLASELKTS